MDSGDMLGRITNRVLDATTHRVVNPTEDRSSVSACSFSCTRVPKPSCGYTTPVWGRRLSGARVRHHGVRVPAGTSRRDRSHRGLSRVATSCVHRVSQRRCLGPNRGCRREPARRSRVHLVAIEPTTSARLAAREWQAQATAATTLDAAARRVESAFSCDDQVVRIDIGKNQVRQCGRPSSSLAPTASA